MPITLYRDTTFTLLGLVESIRRGELALPEIQRPFVWKSTKVRDLFDSMYKGFPVGTLLLWATGAAPSRNIGTEKKEAPPRLLIVDGQQRLTSLYAVLTGAEVLKKDYTAGRIRIAFNPAEQKFAVLDAAIEKDPAYIADITELWRGDYREICDDYFARIEAQRGEPLSRPEGRTLEAAIDRVRDLQHYPFKTVELDASVDETLVAEIFVRINSEGVQLDQADFILTLMSVFDEKGRKELETFSRAAKSPSKSGPLRTTTSSSPRPTNCCAWRWASRCAAAVSSTSTLCSAERTWRPGSSVPTVVTPSSPP